MSSKLHTAILYKYHPQYTNVLAWKKGKYRKEHKFQTANDT